MRGGRLAHQPSCAVRLVTLLSISKWRRSQAAVRFRRDDRCALEPRKSLGFDHGMGI